MLNRAKHSIGCSSKLLYESWTAALEEQLRI